MMNYLVMCYGDVNAHSVITNPEVYTDKLGTTVLERFKLDKARIRNHKGFRFRHDRYGSQGETFFCFGNQKEWFVVLFNGPI